MADQAESSRRAPPRSPPPSPTLPQDEANLWATSESSSSSAPHTDLLSLWLSNYTAHPGPEAEEEPLPDVPTLLNFDLESSFLDLVDWKTTSAAVTQAAPVDTQPLWMQLNAPAEGEADDLSRLPLELQSPEASNLQLALGIQDPEASLSPLTLGIRPQPAIASSEFMAPQASLSPLALGLQSPPASFEIQPPEAPISPLALETESSILPLARGTQFPKAAVSSPPATSSAPSSLSPIPRTLPMAPPLWNLPPIPCTVPKAPLFWNLPSIPCPLPMAPPSWSLPSNPCTLPMPPPLWNLPSVPCTSPTAPPLWNLPPIPCTSPMPPPLWNLLPSPSPVPERRSWSVNPSTPPPAQRQLLLPQSASASVSSSSGTHPGSHQPHDFFPLATTGGQQQVPAVAHASVTFSTPNASANFKFSAELVPTTRPPRLQATAQRRSWTSIYQPWISSTNQDTTKLPIPRRPRFLLPPPAPAPAATMPAPSAPLLANVGNMPSVGNIPSWNAREDAPAVGDQQQRDQQRVQTVGESSRPRKKAKLALDSNKSEPLHWSHNGAQVALIASKPTLNRDGKARALPSTTTNSQILLSWYHREKVKQRIKILQKLIPNGDKVDTVILLEQAHMYIKDLEQQIKTFLKSSVDWNLGTPFVSNMDQSHPE